MSSKVIVQNANTIHLTHYYVMARKLSVMSYFRLRLNPFYQPDSEITNRQFIQRVKHCGQAYWVRPSCREFCKFKSTGVLDKPEQCKSEQSG